MLKIFKMFFKPVPQRYRTYEGNPTSKSQYYPMVNSFSDWAEVSLKRLEEDLKEYKKGLS